MLVAVSLAFIAVFAITYMLADRSRSQTPPAAVVAVAPPPEVEPSGRVEVSGAPVPFIRVRSDPTVLVTTPSTADAVQGAKASSIFEICHTGGGTNCVVDGDTAWINGEKIRIADIDAPETHPSRCDLEADLGGKATRRLTQLMNAAPFDMQVLERDSDRYGRKLRVLVRNGRSLGDQLVAEGLARTWEGRRRPWC